MRLVNLSATALKGGAFIATFPGPDSQSSIPRNPKIEVSDDSVVILNQQALEGQKQYDNYHYDYFGPSIDTGFRIFGLSSQRFFTMSIEVVWAITLAAMYADSDKVDQKYHRINDVVMHGTHVLKGVWRQREYPVFAIDRDHLNGVNKAMAKLQSSELLGQDIIDVCHACHQDDKWPFKLYLPNSRGASFHDAPPDAMEELLAAEPAYVVDELAEPSVDAGITLEAVPLGSVQEPADSIAAS
jgi:hypothetical protein